MLTHERPRSRASSALIFLGLSAIVGCGDDPSQPGDPTSLEITPSLDTIPALGTDAQLRAMVLDDNGNDVGGTAFVWTSSRPLVAAVQTGQTGATVSVTAISNGTAEITAEFGEFVATATIVVEQKPDTIEVTPGADTLLVLGETVELSASARDAGGHLVRSVNFTWESLDESIATVSAEGEVTAVANGVVSIVARGGGAAGSARLSVFTSTISPTGGVVAAADGRVTVEVPAGALSDTLTIVVEPAEAVPAAAALVPGTAFDFGPRGTIFAEAARLAIQYDAEMIPADIPDTTFRLFKLVAQEWIEVDGSTVDTEARVVSGMIESFSVYGILGASTGYTLTIESDSVGPAGKILVFFKVETNQGTPVPDIPNDSFQVRENGNPVSLNESKQVVERKSGQFISHNQLLLDLSGSVVGGSGEDLDLLKTAVGAFIDQIFDPTFQEQGTVDLAISWFDGDSLVHELTAASTDPDVHKNAVNGITPSISTDPSTNLNGAVIQGAELIQSRVDSTAAEGVATIGSLILFTDGTDQANDRTGPLGDEAARTAVEDLPAPISVYSIGLGNEIDRVVLEGFGKTGFAFAESVGALTSSFSEIAGRVTLSARSRYLLQYCSPKRRGAQVELVVRLNFLGLSGETDPIQFTADGFSAACDIN